MSLIKKLGFQLFFICTMLMLFELCISYFYKTPEAYSLEDFIASKPKPFDKDMNFDKIVQNFNGTCKSPAMLHVDGVTSYANDFTCGGVTYQNGKRVTSPSLGDFAHTAHVFGGSTVWGTGVVDAQTIPSILARSLLDSNIRVLNYGVASYVSSQQKNTLNANLNEIKDGDIVIFYDGGNDFWNGVMLGNFDGSIIGFNVRNRSDVYIYKLKNWLSQNISTYQLLSDLKHGRVQINLDSCAVKKIFAESNVLNAAKHYAGQIASTRSIVESRGARFVHFLQPTLFDVNVLSDYEKIVLFHNPCWVLARNFKEDYDNIFLSNSPDSIDLSEVLNNRDSFFDYIHVSALGNEVIVEHILDILK